MAHTYAIRSYYENRALDADASEWEKNGGMFTNYARYHSKKWKEVMGDDDPTVRGRRISAAAMLRARRQFEEDYQEPIAFALELVDRIRLAVENAVEKNGPSDDGKYEEAIGMQAWGEITSDAWVRETAMKIAKDWSNVDPSSFQL